MVDNVENTESGEKTEKKRGRKAGDPANHKPQALFLVVQDSKGRLSQEDVADGSLTVELATRNAIDAVNLQASNRDQRVMFMFEGGIATRS